MAACGKIVAPALLLVFFLNCSGEKISFEKKLNVHLNNFTGEVSVEPVSPNKGYYIRIENNLTGNSDRIYTPYEIFDLQTGDINGDGLADLCIGLIKPTLFDPVLKKRLFIFQIDRDYIRPLWLGSRLVYTLDRFVVLKNPRGPDIIRTIEQKTKDQWLIGEYNWASFGLYPRFPHSEDLSFDKALSRFTKTAL